MAKSKVTAYGRIQQAMRKNEQQVLNYFRKDPTAETWLMPVAWSNALARLETAGMIHYRRLAWWLHS